MRQPPSVTLQGALAPLAKTWGGLGARERRLVAIAALLIAVTLLWLVAVQPAWRTLRSAPAELAHLDAQWQVMQRQASEAQALKNAPAPPAGSAAQAVQALQGATERLGPGARLTLQGERAVLTLTGVDGDAVLEWLAQARRGARARPVEARLTRAGDGYSGTLSVEFGGRS